MTKLHSKETVLRDMLVPKPLAQYKDEKNTQLSLLYSNFTVKKAYHGTLHSGNCAPEEHAIVLLKNSKKEN